MLHDRHKEWIEARGLSVDLAEKLGITTERDASGFWLSVPYLENGRVVNHKYRQAQEKRHRMDSGAPLVLWNQDCLLDAPDGVTAVICEGEWDAMAAMMAGHRYVLSVPNGADAKETEGEIDPETDKMRYVWRARGLLDRVGKFILATDGDAPGLILAAELARRLGPERCMFIDYPMNINKPFKDLNEVLVAFGPDAVRQVLDAAKPYPVKGLFKLGDFPERGEVQTIPIGVPGLSEYLSVVPGTLTVLTGYAGQGKTSLTMAIVANLVRHNVPVTIGTFETMPRPILERRLRAAIIGCAEKSIPAAKIPEADELIADNLNIISQSVDEDDEMALEDVLELARVTVLRDGCKMLILDPWNEIEHKRRPDESETEYTGRALRMLRRFAKDYDVAVWIVAHPAKPDSASSKTSVPGLYHVSGSANWANKPDYGLCYTRPNKDTNIAKVYVLKVKMGLPGKEGDVEIAYDWRTSNYERAA